MSQQARGIPSPAPLALRLAAQNLVQQRGADHFIDHGATFSEQREKSIPLNGTQDAKTPRPNLVKSFERWFQRDWLDLSLLYSIQLAQDRLSRLRGKPVEESADLVRRVNRH